MLTINKDTISDVIYKLTVITAIIIGITYTFLSFFKESSGKSGLIVSVLGALFLGYYMGAIVGVIIGLVLARFAVFILPHFESFCKNFNIKLQFVENEKVSSSFTPAPKTKKRYTRRLSSKSRSNTKTVSTNSHSSPVFAPTPVNVEPPKATTKYQDPARQITYDSGKRKSLYNPIGWGEDDSIIGMNLTEKIPDPTIKPWQAGWENTPPSTNQQPQNTESSPVQLLSERPIQLTSSLTVEEKPDDILDINNSPAKQLPMDDVSAVLNVKPMKNGRSVSQRNSLSDEEIVTRAAVPEREVVLLHNIMQKQMYECLTNSEIVGRTVRVEVDGIDILVNDPDCSTVIEIKTGDNIILNIREAVGQLLEYQYFSRDKIQGRNVQLMIASPAAITEEAKAYLTYLRLTYGLNFKYAQYEPNSYKLIHGN